MDAEQALVELVEARSTALLRTAYLLTGDAGLAEDLVQESLFSVYRARHRLRDPGALEAYVRTTMVRTHINWRKRRSSTELPTERLPEIPAVAPEPDETWPHLARLSAKQRAVVVLAYYEDFSEDQIAAALGCSVGAVKSHRARALASLRLTLGAGTTGGWG